MLTITHPEESTTEKIVGTRLTDYAGVFPGAYKTGGASSPVATFRPTSVKYRAVPAPISSVLRSGHYIDELGRASTFQTNAAGFVTQWVDPAGHTTDFERNDDNLVTRLTEPALATARGS